MKRTTTIRVQIGGDAEPGVYCIVNEDATAPPRGRLDRKSGESLHVSGIAGELELEGRQHDATNAS